MTGFDTALWTASLLAPPLLLAAAAITFYLADRRGTLRRSLAYLVLSRSRRGRFVTVALLGFVFFVPSGVFAFLGSTGAISSATADAWSGVTRLIGAVGLFSAAVITTQDVPVNTAELPEVEEFRAELISLGLAEGVDLEIDSG